MRETYPRLDRMLEQRQQPPVPATVARMDEIAESLRRVSQRIDEHNAHRNPEALTSARIAKLAEEVGETSAAWLGTTGMNPRKGYTHTRGAVKAEALDVAVTALALWEHLDGNRGRVLNSLAEHVRYLDERGLESAIGAREARPDVRHEGSRAELIELLNQQAEGWHHLANDRLQREALDGAAKLEAGDSSVQVENTVYEVTDVDSTPPPTAWSGASGEAPITAGGCTHVVDR